MPLVAGVKRMADGRPITIHVPVPKQSGSSKLSQETAVDEQEAMTELIHLLFDHSKHSHHMLSHLKKRLAEEHRQLEIQVGNDMLEECNTFGDLCGSEDGQVCVCICVRGELLTPLVPLLMATCIAGPPHSTYSSTKH